MELIKDTVRSEMYFKGDARTSSVLCLATPHLGLAVPMAGLDRLLLHADGPVSLQLICEIHINSRVYKGGGGIKDTITFLQRGPYYNRADVQCAPFVSDGEAAPVSARFEVSCAGDIIQVSSLFVPGQDASVAVAVMRVRGGNPVSDGDGVYLRAGQKRVYVQSAQGGMLEVNEDELIIKQPVMGASGGTSYGASLRFCAQESPLFSAPPLAMCVEGSSENNIISAEFDRVRSVYMLDDQYGKDESVDIILENPFDKPVCMPVMLSRKSSSPLGAVLLQNGEQTGIPVQISCERIARGGTNVNFYDFTVAPVVEPGQKLCVTLELTALTCACHLWTHDQGAQLGRVELFASGGGCVLDSSRSRMTASVLDMVSFSDIVKTRYCADMVNIMHSGSRLELNRVRLTDIFSGPLEACAVQEAYTPDHSLRLNIRQSMLLGRDYTRLQTEISISVLADVSYNTFELICLKGRNLYFGNDTSVSYASPLAGEGFRFSRLLAVGEFAGFDGIGVCLRLSEGAGVRADVFSREDGNAWQEVRLRLPQDYTFFVGEQLKFAFTVCLLPTADNYCGKDDELAGSLEVRRYGQLMRREAAANAVSTMAVVGSGEGEITANADRAEALQTGGIGVVPVRFCGIADPSERKVTLKGQELPVQLQLDRSGEYHILAACIAPKTSSERRYKLE